MNLPSQAQVNAATRHAATFAAGAIAMFGLSTKIDPATVQQLIAATGTLVNDVVLIVGLAAPLITSYFASKSATPQAQAASIVKSVPGTKIVTPDENLANAVPSSDVVSTKEAKVVTK